MASTAFKQIPYKKLKQESSYFEDEDIDLIHLREKVIGKIRRKPSSFWNIKLRKVQLRKRLRIKVPSLKKFLRRKSRFIVAALDKILKRLKESQSHFGDLFAGNYMFMQVSPTPLKICAPNTKSPNLKTVAGADYLHSGFSSIGSSRWKEKKQKVPQEYGEISDFPSEQFMPMVIQQFPQKKPVADEDGKIKPSLRTFWLQYLVVNEVQASHVSLYMNHNSNGS